jgi:NAD(P)-dependent dehydrogenase (short-subunit alcohol dehydrogenase family)
VQKVAVVTGAGSGIGRAVAIALGAAGFRLVLTGRRRAPLEDTAQQVPGSVLVLPADITDAEAVTALFARVRENCGRIDLLFNNAGISAAAVPFEELSAQQWRAVIETNLTGAFLCAQAAFRLMQAQRPQGGRIINNGSISAAVPRPHSAPYTASKHAVAGLTKSISLDGRAYDIACGQIDIGNAATAMANAMQTGIQQADGSLRTEPTFDSRYVAEAVVYMASLPLDANVQSLTILATKMPFVGRG